VDGRSGGDLGVGRHVAEDVGPQPAGVGQGRVQQDAGVEGGLRPLGAQVVGGRDHDHPVDLPALDQLGGETEREGGLARAGRRGDEEVPACCRAVGSQRLDLPGAKAAG